MGWLRTRLGNAVYINRHEDRCFLIKLTLFLQQVTIQSSWIVPTTYKTAKNFYSAKLSPKVLERYPKGDLPITSQTSGNMIASSLLQVNTWWDLGLFREKSYHPVFYLHCIHNDKIFPLYVSMVICAWKFDDFSGRAIHKTGPAAERRG